VRAALAARLDIDKELLVVRHRRRRRRMRRSGA
jgi:hypothetical protein